MMTPQYGNQETYIPSSGSPLNGDKVSFYSRLTCLFLDRTTLYPKSRWLALLILMGLFSLRIYTYQGFYIVTYALAIYLLNLFLGFITPRVDPEEEDYILPIRETDEFRPFQRQVNEFKFWLQATKGTLLSLLATCFPILDLPVFWPVLVVYFSFLFIITMRQQIKHMIKHKYVPFSWGKQSYGAITRQRSPKAKFAGKSFAAGFPSMQAKSENLIS
ncbi:uncharacterized protein LOC128883715 [Hylaeus volcanicus]|uniref:uncharacterized protein LOC128883715 n=1 Tax=Hylaeus volcanicus TaxID=313075 RepID=UPI0023B782E5|nr:uncharacterized protein LOC128883715 [Hylaeus volcanicus]